MTRSAIALSGLIIGWVPASRAQEPPVDCVDAVNVELRAGRPSAALERADAGLADPACAAERHELLKARALSSHAVAREAGGSAWCKAQAAYEVLLGSGDARLEALARAGLLQSQPACEAASVVEAPVCPTPAPAPVVVDRGPWALVIAGAVVAGGLGGGLYGWSAYLSDRDRYEVADDRYLADREVAAGLTRGALAAAGVGVVMAVGGLVWLWAGDEAPAVAVGVGPGGLVIGGAF